MQFRELGCSGLKVSALGLGCMGMSEFYGGGDDGESAASMWKRMSPRIDVKLSAVDLRRIDEIFPTGVAAGGRYPEYMMDLVNR